jgi:hypothetical protein
MPLDGTKVALVVSQGLSVVCATCEKYWQARDNGKPGHECLAVGPCGSPIAGDVFHQYVGPMTQFGEFCFVCGLKSTHAIRVKGYVRVIGCCSTHIRLVNDLRAEGKTVSVVIIGKNGESVSDERKPQKISGTLRMRLDDGD